MISAREARIRSRMYGGMAPIIKDIEQAIDIAIKNGYLCTTVNIPVNTSDYIRDGIKEVVKSHGYYIEITDSRNDAERRWTTDTIALSWGYGPMP